MIVNLTPDEGYAAAAVAAAQQIRSVLYDREHDHGGHSRRGQRKRWADTIHGLMAEMALAKALQITWTPGGTRVTTGDVGDKIEVRATEHPAGHLLVYPKDSDAAPFVLMVGHFPEFRIAGWVYGREAKHSDYWRDDKDPPCFWVPQRVLGSIKTLPQA